MRQSWWVYVPEIDEAGVVAEGESVEAALQEAVDLLDLGDLDLGEAGQSSVEVVITELGPVHSRSLELVPCQFCENAAPALTAHRHQGRSVGHASCWDERLRGSE
jgi:predicted RNase H-like HicB family nuclease